MRDISQATRPIMWNIDHAFVMYVMFLVALTVFAYGVYLRVQSWRRGKPAPDRLSNFPLRAIILVKELFLQKKVRESKFPAIFHSFIFYAFLVLVITTGVVAMDYDLGTSYFKGIVYVVLTVGAEIAGALILIGTAMAFYRRYFIKPPTLARKPADAVALGLLATLIVSGFLVEGLRMAATPDPWYYLSPVGYAVSLLFAGLSASAVASIHKAFWWFHTAVGMSWIASLPYTKFSHLITLPLNVYFRKLRPRGELMRPDIEELMNDPNTDFDNLAIGLNKPDDFTWKQRLDFDACIECGRCEEVCPAVKAGSSFSPKTLIAKCRELANSVAPRANGPDDSEKVEKEIAIVGEEGLTEDFIWRCRTCMACMTVCPACIDHVDTLVDIRRNELLVKGRIPQDAKYALKLLESNGNPFGPQSDRVSWIEKLNIPIIEEGQSVDVLYWIGCCTTFDPTNQKIAQDVCALLKHCGLDYGVLGRDEKCCGDPARLMGEERLFQEIAKKQIERIYSRKFKIIVTSCPHCLNVLKNEYRQLGGRFNAVHHTEFLHEMVWNEEIVPKYGKPRKAVYHDPCYLGRYQKIYDAPREVLRAIPGCQMMSLDYSKGQSFCCGGGGGHFWMDLKERKRINSIRMEQLEKTGADTVVTACSYCKKMLDDGLKMRDLDDKIEIIDIASLVLNSVRKDERKKPCLEEMFKMEEDRTPSAPTFNDSLQAAARLKTQES